MSNEKGLAIQEALQQTTRATAGAHRQRWTRKDVETIREHLEEYDYHLTAEHAVEMARVLGRTYGAIIVKAGELREEHRLAQENKEQLDRIPGGTSA